jgi:hypothetical protein
MTDTDTRRDVVTEPPPPTFGRCDYADAFSIVREPGDSRTPETVARDVLDRSPWAFRTFVPILWRLVVGFRLGPRPSPDHVLGWKIIETTPEITELRTHSWQATGGVIVRLQEKRVLFTTFMRYENRLTSRAMWSVLAPVHRFFVPYLLRWDATGRRREQG